MDMNNLEKVIYDREVKSLESEISQHLTAIQKCFEKYCDSNN